MSVTTLNNYITIGRNGGCELYIDGQVVGSAGVDASKDEFNIDNESFDYDLVTEAVAKATGYAITNAGDGSEYSEDTGDVAWEVTL